jgi:hypothetical protein
MGATTKQILLLDSEEDPLLLQMADPSSPYVLALGSFRTRCAYANATNDFLVAYETASLDPDAPETLRRRRAAAAAAGTRRGPRGGRIGPGKTTPPLETNANANGWKDANETIYGGWGGGFGGSGRIVDERRVVPESEEGGAFWRNRRIANGKSERRNPSGGLGIDGDATATTANHAIQRAIADGLRTVEWCHVDVEFPGVAPLAHNKICALQRDPVMKFLFKEGEWVVEHQAEFLTGRRSVG